MSNQNVKPTPMSCASPQFPLISIVIPVRNEEAHIGAVLDQLMAQDYPSDRFEILIVDGNSTDRTVEVVQTCGRSGSHRIVVLPNPGQLSSAGRNVGIHHSRGDIVIFIDGHCFIPTRTLLSDTVRILESTEADCLCRPQPLIAGSGNTLQSVVAHARASMLGHGRDSIIYDMQYEGFADPTSSGATYRRCVFERIGLYDKRFDACEDVEFNHRVHEAGLKSYASPRLAVFYQARGSFAGLFKQLMRYGRGRFRLIRKHPDAASLGQLLPGSLLLGLVAGAFLSYMFPSVRIFYLGAFALYVGLLLGFSASLALRYGWPHLILAPAVYATIHFGLGLGYWVEACGVRPRGSPSPAGSSDQTVTSKPMDLGARVPALGRSSSED